MSVIKMNYTEFADLELNIEKAYESLKAAEDCWGTNFDNLYNNIVASGWLDSLYDDAESNWHVWRGTITVVASIAAFAVALATPVGWIATAIAALGAIFGIGTGIKTIAKTPDWFITSKEVFAKLLSDCMNGNDDNYIRIANLATKFYNIEINLEKIKSKVNDFNKEGANFDQSADAYGLSLRTAGDDGATIVGIETEVVIDGKTITMDTSEAMSALYTYAYTVTSTVIAADYLERTYGYDIDFLGLVTNANAFMADTIQSDLYTPEMIQLILPSYAPDENAAYLAASAATGLDQSELQAALGDVSSLGIAPLFAGLVGSAFMVPINGLSSSVTTPDSTPSPSPNPTTPSPSPNPTTPSPSPNPTTPSPSPNPTTPSPSPNPTTPDQTENPTTPSTLGTTAVTTPVNDIEIDPIIETDVELDEDILLELGVLDDEGNIDYDQLAYEEYQFETGAEAIEEYRLELTEDVDARYSSGDFTSLTNELKGYGYTTTQIATILASKSMTIKAVLDGNTRGILVDKATEMAKADGVKNYDSKFKDNPSTSELADDKKPLRTLHVNSDNKKIVKMEENLGELEEDYRTKVEEANSLLDEAAADKKAVDALKEKYEKEYGTDTTKWTEEAAKEYDEAVDKYNSSAEAANKAIESANDAKESYHESREEFEKACENYYKSKILDEEEENQSNYNTSYDTSNSGSVGMNSNGLYGADTSSSGTSSQDGYTVNADGTMSFGSNLSNTSNSVTNTSGTTTSTASPNVSGNYISEDEFMAKFGFKTDKDNN